MPLSTWDLPRPGIEPMSLDLAGGFFTTEPPGSHTDFRGNLELSQPHLDADFSVFDNNFAIFLSSCP